MTSEQIKQYKELTEKKDLYIELCSNEDPAMGARVSYLFWQLEEIFPQYYSDMLDSGLAAMNAVNAYKAHKVDPYIAGGIGQGIGGVGTGIVSAVSASQRNERIDAWREESTRKSAVARSKSEESEGILVSLLNELVKIIDSSQNVQKYRYDQVYQSGESFLRKQKYLEAFACFLKTRNYKKTEEYINNIRDWWKSERRTRIVKIVISFLIAIVTAIICFRSYNNSLVSNSALDYVRTYFGMIIMLLAPLPVAIIGAGYTKSYSGLIPGLAIGVGGLLMGLASTESKDKPNGDLELVGTGLFLIAASIIADCAFYIYYHINEIKRIDSDLQ